jgi:hypothetical protein
VGNYREKNRIRFGPEIRPIWKEENGDYEYVKGTIENIEFNVKQ